MTKKELITQTLVNKITISIEKKNTSELHDVWDTKTAGFGIRVGKTGATYIFKYRNKYVLKNLCLEIKPGERVGIVGQSGAGKIGSLKRVWV